MPLPPLTLSTLLGGRVTPGCLRVSPGCLWETPGYLLGAFGTLQEASWESPG